LAAKSIEPGESLYCAGSPSVSGETWVTRSGTVESVRFSKTSYKSGQVVEATLVTSTMQTKPGTSGTGVVNARGELVGIHAMGSYDSPPKSSDIELMEVKAFLREAGVLRSQPTPSPSPAPSPTPSPAPRPASSLAGTHWSGHENLQGYGVLR